MSEDLQPESTATPQRARSRWHRLAAAAGAGSLALTLTTMTSSTPAWAHSALKASTPPNGAQLTTMPEHIVLTFSTPLSAAGASVVLADGDGSLWPVQLVTVRESTVSASVTPDAPDGRYEIRWRVVSADGAALSGVVRFMVGTATTDEIPLHTVLTAHDAALIRLIVAAVVGGLLSFTAYRLLVVYGCKQAPHPIARRPR